MKLIDEKGKLFGKISIIDIVVVLLVLAVVAFGGYKLTRGGIGAAEKTIKANVTFLAVGVTDDVANTNIQGMFLVTGANQSNGKVISREIVEGPNLTYSAALGEVKENPLNNIVITAEVDLVDRDKMYKLGSDELRIGEEYEFRTKNFYAKTVVQKIEIIQ